MNYGLKEEDLAHIIMVIKMFPEIDKAVIFGSRAKGTNKNGSDVDLAILGEKITFDTIAKLHSLLEDQSPMPYLFDIIDYTHLKHGELKRHIERAGKTIYEA